jgi:hypothetical protein
LPISWTVVPFVLIMLGFVLGFFVGRWSVLTAAVVLGLLTGVTDETDLPGWFMGLYFGLPAAIGIASGIVTRRVLARRRRAARA